MSHVQKDVADCTCTTCMMAQMFKQRILFQNLDREQQDNCARVLAKRAESVQDGSNIGEAMRVLFLGTAWLRVPEYPRTEPVTVEPQMHVLKSVVDALESMDLSAVDTHDRMAPALHIIQEILQASTLNLHDADGSKEWLKISSALRKVTKRKLAKVDGIGLSGSKMMKSEVDTPGTAFRGAGSAASCIREPEETELDLERGLTGRRLAMQTKAKTGKPIVLQRVKQSGIQGVSWKETMGSWSVAFAHPVTGKNTGKHFGVARFMAGGLSWEEADELSLQAAIDFRQELVKKKILAPATRHLSRVQGVGWSSTNKCWHAWIMDDEADSTTRKKPLGEGNWVKREFYPMTATPEAFEMARIQAEQCRQQWERDSGVEIVHAHAKTIKELVNRKSGVRNITWDKWGECWHVVVTMPSGRVQRRFRPEGTTNDAIEAARQDAIKAREGLITMKQAQKDRQLREANGEEEAEGDAEEEEEEEAE